MIPKAYQRLRGAIILIILVMHSEASTRTWAGLLFIVDSWWYHVGLIFQDYVLFCHRSLQWVFCYRLGYKHVRCKPYVVPEVNWSSDGDLTRAGGLIPHEDKWKRIKHSTCFFSEGAGEFDPLWWREVEVKKPLNINCSEGMGDLIPYEEKRNLVNYSTYLFRGGGGFDSLSRLDSPSRKRPC